MNGLSCWPGKEKLLRVKRYHFNNQHCDTITAEVLKALEVSVKKLRIIQKTVPIGSSHGWRKLLSSTRTWIHQLRIEAKEIFGTIATVRERTATYILHIRCLKTTLLKMNRNSLRVLQHHATCATAYYTMPPSL